MSERTWNFYNESGVIIDWTPLEKCAEIVVSLERPIGAFSLSVLLCSDAEMLDYNHTYRGHGSITDVLCFTTENLTSTFSTPDAPGIVCDIIIDINQIDRQKGNRSLDEELWEVFLHGILHGLGYDHIRHQDQNIMTAKEKYYKQMMEGTR